MVTRRHSVDLVKGFTLVELAVMLAIIAMLLLMAAPFARGWIDNNRQMQIRHLLWEGVSQARALALRNPNAVPVNLATDSAANPVVCLRFTEDDELTVNLSRSSPGKIGRCDTASVQRIWSVKLPHDTLLRLTSSLHPVTADALVSAKPFSCLALNARAQRLTRVDQCTDSDLTLDQIAIGFHAQDPLYVHLF